MLPKFIIIGAARCGTSSLFLNLLQHPRVRGPNIGGNHKEVHFFDSHYGRGLEWYKNRFPAAEDTIYIEATPNYLYHSKVPARAKECLPDTRFIILLRNPVDRAWSHYWHWKDKLKWDLSVLKNPKHVILKKGIYLDQIKRWYETFEMPMGKPWIRKEKFVTFRSEDYFDEEKVYIKHLFNRMGLEPIEIKPKYWDPKRKITIKKPYPDMPKDLRAYLENFYRPHNRRLSEYLYFDMMYKDKT